MKIKLTTKKLIAAISSVSANVQKKSLLPINSFVLLTIKDSRFSVTTSSESAQMSQFFSIDEDIEFLACVHCTLLLNTIKLLKSEDIELEVKTRKNGSKYLFIKAGRGSYKLDMTNPEAFSFLKFGDTIDTLTVTGDNLFEKIKIASGCVNDNDVRPQFTAITIRSEGNNGVITGFSPSCGTEQNVSVVSGSIKESFIPKHICTLLGMNVMSGETIVSVSEKRIKINNGSFEMIGTLINATPLKLDAIWSQQSEDVYTVNRQDLLDSVARVLNFTGIDDKMVVLKFDSDQVKVMADDINNGNSGEEIVPVIDTNCGELMIGLNGTFLSACLRSISTQEVTINAKTANVPIFIQDSAIGNPTQKWIIAPVIIQNAMSYREDAEEKRKTKAAAKGTIGN